MRVLVIIFTLVVAAYARPDVSHLPSGSYLPTANQGSNHAGVGSVGSHPQNEDQKHVYFYAGQDDQQTSRFRIFVTPNSQRHSKIIFVKAPSYGGVVPEVVAPQSLSEDKTLVYVLSKNPAQDGSVTIPAGLGVKHAKPEVYFIKYNNKQEAHAQISGGLEGQQVGVNIPDVGNANSFVNSLPSETSNQGVTGSAGGSAYGPPGVSGPY